MILSHKYKFIFLKTNKTAGTSIEIALSKFCGPNDIITPISPDDEAIRASLGYRGPQNYETQVLADNKSALSYYNHMSMLEIRSLIGSTIFNSYFKFCVERNPWDRIVSLYYYRFRNRKKPPFKDFLASKDILILKERGWSSYHIDDSIAVDMLCAYEHLAKDLETVRQKLELPEQLELPGAKSGFRTKGRNYQDYYSPMERDFIAELFEDEIEVMGYTF